MRLELKICAILSLWVSSCGLFADDPAPVEPDCSITGTCASSSSANVVISSSSTSVGPVYFGTLPANANPDLVNALYVNQFKPRYISTPAEDAVTYAGKTYAANPSWWLLPPGTPAARVKWDRDTMTVSEGIGYGMLIAMFAGDWNTFNGLWVYNRKMREEGRNKGLMPWLLYGFYSAEQNASATDGDLDIVTALILAYQKTGVAEYLQDALLIGNAIWTYEIDPTNLLIWPANDKTYWSPTKSAWNPSYFSPVAFRLLAQYDPNHPWLAALDANYNWLLAVQNDATGLFCDWAYANGVCGRPANQSATSTLWQYHGLEALRITWRLTWDYHWYGEPRAKAMMSLLANWLIQKTGGNPALIGGAQINPATGDWSNADGSRAHFVGNFCLPGMVDPVYLNWTTACNQQMLSRPYPSSVATKGYFSDILVLMFAQLLNGWYVK